MSNERKIAQGEILVKAGTRPTNFYVVESGNFSVFQSSDVINELYQVQQPEIIGEEVLFGSPIAENNVMAVEEDSSVFEVPVEAFKKDLLKADPRLVTIVKALAERLRLTSNELKTMKTATGALPCPPASIPKVFGVIYHAALRRGKKSGDNYEVLMSDLEDFTIDLMGETPYRVHSALKILLNLEYVQLDAKNATNLIFTKMFYIETFIDFYRSYYFRNNGALVLRTNEKIKNITLAVLKVSEGAPADRSGVVRIPYKPTIDSMKELLGASFEADQLFSIEQKGLQIKKITSSDGGLLSFYRAEFEQMIHNWRFLREIENWNSKGFV